MYEISLASLCSFFAKLQHLQDDNGVLMENKTERTEQKKTLFCLPQLAKQQAKMLTH